MDVPDWVMTPTEITRWARSHEIEAMKRRQAA
jgi:hypothetical protein